MVILPQKPLHRLLLALLVLHPLYCLPDHKIPHSSMLKQEGPQGNDSPQLSENQNLLNPESHTWSSPILVSTFPLQIYINFLRQFK